MGFNYTEWAKMEKQRLQDKKNKEDDAIYSADLQELNIERIE